MNFVRRMGNLLYRSGLIRELFGIYLVVWMWVTTRLPLGRNIFSEDWDLLVILDACRTDALWEVAPEYEFLDRNSIEARWSVGSTSKEWMLKTFIEKHSDDINHTSYICANSFVQLFEKHPVNYVTYMQTRETWVANNGMLNRLFDDDLVKQDAFLHLEDLSVHGDVNEYGPTPRAEIVTDYAIHTSRNYDHNRLLVHYMQPHVPYLKYVADRGNIRDFESDPWDALRSGEDFDTVWTAYLDNLRYVLDEVKTLLRNVDAETVVLTADHGELFGELGQYGHSSGIPHPDLKKVPWAITTAEDFNEHSPNLETIDDEHIDSTKDRLEALGYR